MPNFLDELRWRGMIHDSTPGLEDYVGQPGFAGYIGFDPTAPSLHIGNLATTMLLVHLQRAGGRPIALVGGATGRIGDPSGKREERKLLELDVLATNQQAVEKQLRQLLDFSAGSTQAQVVNNYDWFRDMPLLDFLRDVGKHLTVNYMLAKDSVQNRLESGLSFTEFTYQLIQGYDFAHLHQHHGCKLQLGGSDQWGNITAGTELIRRMYQGEAYALTTPLLTKADGTKFGKSESGNIWLDPHLTSPYKFYQYWLNLADEDLQRVLYVFSLSPKEVLDQLLGEHTAAPHKRAGQQALAEEITQRIHGPEALAQAKAATEVLFGDAPLSALGALTDPALLDVFEGVPQATLPITRFEAGYPIVDMLAEGGVASSKSEARRMLSQGSIRINKVKVESEDTQLQREELVRGRYLLVQRGKKNYHLLIAK